VAAPSTDAGSGTGAGTGTGAGAGSCGVLGTQQHSTASVGEHRGMNVSIVPQVDMLGGQVAAPSTGAVCGVGSGTGAGAGAGSCGVLQLV
jgi:hypothetical protein